MARRLLRIGELAEAAGVSTRTVDYYTGLGLVTPAARTSGNFRLYDPESIERIAAVRQLEGLGMGLDQIVGALRGGPSGDLTGALDGIQRDLDELQSAIEAAGPEAQCLLTAVTARAHSLIAAALEIATGLPPIA